MFLIQNDVYEICWELSDNNGIDTDTNTIDKDKEQWFAQDGWNSWYENLLSNELSYKIKYTRWPGQMVLLLHEDAWSTG